MNDLPIWRSGPAASRDSGIYLRLELTNGDCLVAVKPNPRARRLTLRVENATGAVRVTAPVGLRLSAIERFLRRHADWVEERLARLPPRIRFLDGAHIPVRGMIHRIAANGSLRGLVRVEADEAGPPCLSVPGAEPHIERRVTDYLKKEARRDLEVSVAAYLEKTGTSARRIVLRDGVSRWGSCAANGVLSFSWRLILAPPLILDYVAAHEVAHLRHMNHGARYWRLVHEICPATEEAKAWMAVNGAGLHAYGPPPGRAKSA